jgi:hypothetical protein
MHAININDYTMIYYIIDQHCIDNASEVLQSVSKKGYLELVKLLIKKGVHNLSYGLNGAIEGNHINLVKFFVSKIREKKYRSECYLNEALEQAAKFANRYLIDYFSTLDVVDWNFGLYGAAEGGHLDLIEYFINKDANEWDFAMESAAVGGNKDLIEFFIRKGAHNFDCGMQGAIYGNNLELVDYFIEKGARNWYLGMVASLDVKCEHLINFFAKKGANNINKLFDYCFVESQKRRLRKYKNIIQNC